MAFEVVVVEDAGELAASIAKTLRREGFRAHVAGDAETGLELARELPADLVLLDISLPGIDGIEACRRLRLFSSAYVIMLTGHVSEVDRLRGLTVGADDYMTKPFFPRELVARIQAMRRRPRPSGHDSSPIRRFGALEIDPERQGVTLGGEAVALSQIEYRLLGLLSADVTRTVSREELLRRAWGDAWVEDAHLLDVHISNLRRKLGDDPRKPRYVKTVRGLGFRMGEG